MKKRTLAIIGVGLIGGSLARSLKKTDPDCRIIAFARFNVLF